MVQLEVTVKSIQIKGLQSSATQEITVELKETISNALRSLISVLNVMKKVKVTNVE